MKSDKASPSPIFFSESDNIFNVTLKRFNNSNVVNIKSEPYDIVPNQLSYITTNEIAF